MWLIVFRSKPFGSIRSMMKIFLGAERKKIQKIRDKDSQHRSLSSSYRFIIVEVCTMRQRARIHTVYRETVREPRFNLDNWNELEVSLSDQFLFWWFVSHPLTMMMMMAMKMITIQIGRSFFSKLFSIKQSLLIFSGRI